MYIIFLILASTNLSFNFTTLNIIQTKVEIILDYFIGFIIERYKNGLDKDLLLPCLNEVFVLILKVLKRTYDQRSKRKGSKIFDKIISMTTAQKKQILVNPLFIDYFLKIICLMFLIKISFIL